MTISKNANSKEPNFEMTRKYQLYSKDFEYKISNSFVSHPFANIPAKFGTR